MKRPPGRPPLDDHERSIPLQVSLPAKQFAAVTEHAKHDRLTVQDWIRRVLRHATENKSV